MAEGDNAPAGVQLSRRRGWRMPPNCVKVDRSTRWGNPFRVGDYMPSDPRYTGIDLEGIDLPLRDGRAWIPNAEISVRVLEAWLRTDAGQVYLRDARQALAGKHLGCWCRVSAPCHRDLLLRLVN